MDEPRHTILVVEDEPHILDIVTFLLEDRGYRVLKASEGQSALSVAHETRPDLIISDVKMPRMDGFTLCKRVRSDPAMASLPFIFLTAHGERADVRRGMGLGADDYLTKPFEPEDLLAAVEIRLSRAAQARAALDRASANLQDQVVRILTHEFRTPLALVAGFTELLESTGQGMGEKEFQVALNGLHTGSKRLTSMVEDFLLLTRLNTGAVQREVTLAQPAALCPEPVVTAALDGARQQAEERNITLVARCTAGGASINVQREHLCQIVCRLLDNALKFFKAEGGEVWVISSVEGDCWRLAVEDEGIGIEPEATAGIFDAFLQLDRGQNEQQGLGLGLTIVRGLVQVYGGQVTVQSVLGRGSTFVVQLPLAGSEL